MFNHRLGDGAPTPVITVAAIAVLPLTVPIFLAEPAGHFRAFGFIMGVDALKIVPAGAFMQGLDKVYLGHEKPGLKIRNVMAHAL